MSEHQNETVAERQMRQAFDEVSGRVTAPDRLDAILRRAEGASRERFESAAVRPTGRLWAAALLLLGLSATIAAAVLKERNDADEPASAVASGASEFRDGVVATAVQDPKPGQQGQGQQGSGQQGQGKPKTSKPGVSPPEAGKPQTGKPQPGKPQPGKPQPGKPQTGKSNQGEQEPKRQEPGKSGKPNADKQLPKGTDPADLAVLRSAEAMLEAEKRLAALIKAGKIAGVDEVLPFSALSGWEYKNKLEGMPKQVRDLDGKKVLMLGFMLPLDEIENIQEFLLVESLWSCCFGTPPNIHGIVRCVMPKAKALDYQFEPLKVVGTLKVAATEQEGYCVDIYQLHVDYLEVIE